MRALPDEAWALAGPRVRLRRLRAADTAAFHALRGDVELGRYQGWSALSLSEAASFIEAVATPEALPFCPAGDWLQIAIADTASDTLLGDIGLHLHADGQALEIGSRWRARRRARAWRPRPWAWRCRRFGPARRRGA